MDELKNRIDFVWLIDVQNGNPNGDPDAGNLPRIDAQTGEGLITDVCLKRKVRNYVQMTHAHQAGFDIFIKEKAILNQLIEESHSQSSMYVSSGMSKLEAARQWMCQQYYDVRTFGAVMTTGSNAGQVRGPIQLTFARSIEPIVSLEQTITRMAVTTEKEALKQQGGNQTMGRKSIVPYGLYICYGFISPHLAQQTGFNEEDLAVFWQALINMFDFDRSSSHGLMSTRKLLVFRHNSALGNAPAHQLFDLVRIHRCSEGPARSFEDYEVEIQYERLPQNITLEELVK